MKRQITIYESAQNGKITVFNDVEVSTLGELKQLLDQKGISYADMEFIEGVTNTKLLSDDSRLPENIPFKGKVTNNVFINILRKESKIKSGIDYYDLSRAELLHAAKPYAEDINAHFGKNYTQVKSDALAEWLDLNAEESEEEEPETEEPQPQCEECSKKKEAVITSVVTLIKSLGIESEVLEALQGNDSFFTPEDMASFLRK